MSRETPEAKLTRMTERERALWARGCVVAGIDEVGRGPLVGPVTSACIIVPESKLVPGVDDSKKLSEKKREALFERLMDAASYVRWSSMSAADIDRLNILNATKLTMERAAEGAESAHFLVDAVTGLSLPGPAESIVHGDACCYMIAAASIIAKVTRDRYMRELHEKYPEYNFLSNKGYGTAEHIAALKAYGPCPEHRRSFLKNILGANP